MLRYLLPCCVSFALSIVEVSLLDLAHFLYFGSSTCIALLKRVLALS